jgi:ClpA/ClpB-like protein
LTDFAVSLAASPFGLTLGLVAGVVTLIVLAVRRALEGRTGVEFADLGTAAIVAVAVGLVPVIGAFIASRQMRREFGGWMADPTGTRMAHLAGELRRGEWTEPQQRVSSAVGGRFDTFTDRARKVLTLAQDEAQRFNHNYIGTEHLLLGLVRERQGLAARVLVGMGIELEQIRTAVEFSIGRGDQPITGEIAITPRAKRVLELAIDEARRMGHTYIGTEHLLLGLAREGEGIAAGVLQSLGLDLDRIRHEVIRTLAGSARQAPQKDAPGSDPPDYEAPHPPA